MKGRICADCGKEQPLSAFSLAGGLRRRSYCKTCEKLLHPHKKRPASHQADQGFAAVYPTKAKKIDKIGQDIFSKLGV